MKVETLQALIKSMPDEIRTVITEYCKILVYDKTDVFQNKFNFCLITYTNITKMVQIYSICLLYLLPKVRLKILSSFRVIAIIFEIGERTF